MDVQRARLVRTLLDGTAWVERTRDFARALRSAGHESGGLLLVGTPDDEPWHLTAHLDDEARYSQIPELTPTLVRHRVPPGAPPHLAVDLRRLQDAGRRDTLLVVAPDEVPAGLLERFDDARRRGTTLLALESGDRELRSLAHEALTVVDPADREPDSPARGEPLWPSTALQPADLVGPGLQGMAFETAQHLVSLAAGEPAVPVGRKRGFRDRLARFLEAVSGPDRP